MIIYGICGIVFGLASLVASYKLACDDNDPLMIKSDTSVLLYLIGCFLLIWSLALAMGKILSPP